MNHFESVRRKLTFDEDLLGMSTCEQRGSKQNNQQLFESGSQLFMKMLD